MELAWGRPGPLGFGPELPSRRTTAGTWGLHGAAPLPHSPPSFTAASENRLCTDAGLYVGGTAMPGARKEAGRKPLDSQTENSSIPVDTGTCQAAEPRSVFSLREESMFWSQGSESFSFTRSERRLEKGKGCHSSPWGFPHICPAATPRFLFLTHTASHFGGCSSKPGRLVLKGFRDQNYQASLFPYLGGMWLKNTNGHGESEERARTRNVYCEVEPGGVSTRGVAPAAWGLGAPAVGGGGQGGLCACLTAFPPPRFWPMAWPKEPPRPTPRSVGSEGIDLS